MRLENLVGTGMPDINGCLNGVETWIETKLVRGNRLKFEKMQPSWILKRCLHGGRVFVFARQRDTFLLWTGWQSWNLAKTGTLMKDGCISVDIRNEPPLFRMNPPYDWRLLVEVLFTRSFPENSSIKSSV